MTLTIGELFAGYGGLGMGVQEVLDAEVIWFSEIDPAPSRILAHHWPDVPNHGDITRIDWTTVEHPDILTGGFPCQDVSLAGARAGLKDGTRSGLWSYFATAIGALRPSLVLIENVRGLLSAEASGPMESDPWGVGDGATGPSLRAIGAVLGDLSDLGYDAEWCGVRAADAGAPHGRFRVFILAYPNSEGFGSVGRLDSIGRDSHGCGGQNSNGHSAEPAAPADTQNDGRERDRASRNGRTRSEDGGQPSADTSGDEPERWRGNGDVAGAPRPDQGDRDQRQRDGNATRDRRATAADPIGGGRDGRARAQWRGTRNGTAAPRSSADALANTGRVRGREGHHPSRLSTESTHRAGVVDERSPRPGSTEWGEYGPAIRRWETILNREAPNPTEADGRNQQHRLSARFVEWMMGAPEGHITGVGLTRNECLKALGNGVVPQQAALALKVLLARQQAAA